MRSRQTTQQCRYFLVKNHNIRCLGLVMKVALVTAWAIAFAYVEAAVVDYLRALYYPLAAGGFQFPLQTWDQLMAMGSEHVRRLLIEMGRECATMVMLAAIGIIAGRNKREAWAHFMIAFGVWDIFYYVWLKIFLDWPPSLVTWDLLFLVPVPWVAPVIAPVIISLFLIGSGLIALWLEEIDRPLSLSWLEWGFVSLGGLVVIISFCWDVENILNGGLPQQFQWGVFFAGLAISVITFGRHVYRRF